MNAKICVRIRMQATRTPLLFYHRRDVSQNPEKWAYQNDVFLWAYQTAYCTFGEQKRVAPGQKKKKKKERRKKIKDSLVIHLY